MEWALPHLWPLVISGGFVVGFLVGLTGVGAGSLTTPFLITVIGVNPVVAVGTDLLFACITKASSAWRHHRLRNVDTSILGWLAVGSLPAAGGVFALLSYSGTATAALAGNIRLILAAALLLSALAITMYPLLATKLALADGVGVIETKPRVGLTIALGAVIGALVALTSVGAGAIGVVALTVIYPALAIRRLVGTDIVHAIPLTLVAGLGHLSLGHLDVPLLATLLLGSVPGIALGARLTGTLPDQTLRVILSAVLCLAAFTLVYK